MIRRKDISSYDRIVTLSCVCRVSYIKYSEAEIAQNVSCIHNVVIHYSHN